MTIYYADELGIIGEKVDENGIDFCDGFAYFNDTKIAIDSIRYISKTE